MKRLFNAKCKEAVADGCLSSDSFDVLDHKHIYAIQYALEDIAECAQPEEACSARCLGGICAMKLILAVEDYSGRYSWMAMADIAEHKQELQRLQPLFH